ncbi:MULTISPECIES: hypothetical protein [unclassified Ensifer]|uniref:hypothetical protein n=1 Tax=unclassified Ensifer TaxID=2633371 RepID=UPI000812D511|nr:MULTISPECIES: hypothetical protein [unclassified Ensifer]OCO98759.1 hypothetical protein BC362_28825 [Ensifer sp. LC14]OCP13238.1 hypothetical protein BC374_13440 [Ensifer sp. LC13]OCP13840.1 hypothetical protein BBX50_13720 [Ensifer sp. LC11]OCP28219.1 hypothetical protein BC364_11840 [Ensifer sp. LC499]
MKLLLQISTAIIVVLIFAVWLASLRLVVLPPGSFKLRAMTALVYQGHGYRLIDSPLAMCGRQVYPTDDCEQVAMNHLANRVLLRLPYSQWLYDFTEPSALRPTASVEDTPLRNSVQ